MTGLFWIYWSQFIWCKKTTFLIFLVSSQRFRFISHVQTWREIYPSEMDEMFYTQHMGPEGVRTRKKKPSFLLMPNCHKLRKDSKNVSLKIGSWGPQKLGPFSHFSSWEKWLYSGQKWFLRPYFPLIRGIFLLKSGLRFSFRALEVPEPRVRKRPY